MESNTSPVSPRSTSPANAVVCTRDTKPIQPRGSFLNYRKVTLPPGLYYIGDLHHVFYQLYVAPKQEPSSRFIDTKSYREMMNMTQMGFSSFANDEFIFAAMQLDRKAATIYDNKERRIQVNHGNVGCFRLKREIHDVDLDVLRSVGILFHFNDHVHCSVKPGTLVKFGVISLYSSHTESTVPSEPVYRSLEPPATVQVKLPESELPSNYPGNWAWLQYWKWVEEKKLKDEF